MMEASPPRRRGESLRPALARYLPLLVYTALTLAIAYPLLRSGYVFALDHAMGPQSAAFYARYITDNTDPIQSKGGFALILAGLDLVLPMEVVQRILLFTPFLLAGLGMRRLAAERAPEAAALVGGVIYMLSPFAYIRGVAGQMGVLWAYALAPWFLHAWFRATETSSRRSLALAVLLLSLTAAFQAHGAVLLALVVGIHTLVRLARAPAAWRSKARAPALFAGLVLLANAYWIVPVLLAPETTLTRITQGDRDFFAMRSAGFPSVGIAAITLQGFWREGYETFYAASPWLLAVPALLLVLSVHGLRIASRDERTLTIAFTGVAGFLLGVGASSAITAPLFDLAWDHVSLMKGFRDSHKFLALLALAYGALVPLGLADAMSRLRVARAPAARRWGPWAIVAIVAAAPIASATPLWGGYHGQLGATEYPPEWAAAEQLTRDCTGSMVVLPWHLYIDLSWIPNKEKRVTNPAKLAFTCPVISSDNVEAGTTASQSSSSTARYVEHWLSSRGARNITTLGNLLAPVNVQYVLVLKEADWRPQATDLAGQRDLRLVLDNALVQVYENQAPISAAWRTDRVVAIDELDDLLAMSTEGPLAGAVYVGPDRRERAAPRGVATPVDARGVARTAFEVDDAEGRYLVFTPPPGGPEGRWVFEGVRQSGTSLGTSVVFDAPGGGRVASSEFARIALPAWGLSLVALAGLAGALVWRERVQA